LIVVVSLNNLRGRSYHTVARRQVRTALYDSHSRPWETFSTVGWLQKFGITAILLWMWFTVCTHYMQVLQRIS